MPDSLLPRLTLLIGVVALGLVIIPAIVYDQPAPWQKREVAPPPPTAQRSGELRVKFKGIELSWGRKSATQPNIANEAAPAVPPPPPQPPKDPVKIYKVSAVILALAGLIVGTMAWRNSAGRQFVVSGVVLCCAAILWHYIVAGVVAAVGVALLLVIFGSFG